MQPAQGASGGGDGGNRQLKRWGPIIGVLAVVAIGAGVIVATSGGDDEGSATDVTTESTAAPATTTSGGEAPVTTEGESPATTADTGTATTAPAAGEVTFPLSFSDATEQGIADQIDWGERCDTTTGRVAVPDFFAPECFAPFTGDNGGATDTGVTAEEITIVQYEGQEADPIIAYITDAIRVEDTNEQQFETMRGLVDYYTTYYELYGRKVNLVHFEGTGNATDEIAARADAALIAEEYDPFVVLGGPALTSAFADELAANEIMCISCTPAQTADWYVERDPYVWGLDGSAGQKQLHVLEFIEKQLIGKNAEFGGDDVIDQPRVFGLLYLESSAASAALADEFEAGMEALGSPFAERVAYALDPATIQATASQAISKMKAAGVTTIVFAGDPVAPRDFTREATAQDYSPEWLVAASTLVDTTAFARTYDQDQWRHAFGVTSLAARTSPRLGAFGIYEWFTGEEPPAKDSIGVIAPSPGLFFAVAQFVGPNLTHENFKAALFAFPGTTAAISQPFLSWGDQGFWPDPDYQGIDDATMIWWDPAATGIDEIRKEGTGMWQYVDGGARYLPGQWPTEPRLFDPTGAVTIYDEPPPGEAPGDYPSPAG
jgi:hypothetical protein